jgi:hypothetical protein
VNNETNQNPRKSETGNFLPLQWLSNRVCHICASSEVSFDTYCIHCTTNNSCVTTVLSSGSVSFSGLLLDLCFFTTRHRHRTRAFSEGKLRTSRSRCIATVPSLRRVSDETDRNSAKWDHSLRLLIIGIAEWNPTAW